MTDSGEVRQEIAETYDGPMIAQRGVADGEPWIWVANGSAQDAFAPPTTLSRFGSFDPVEIDRTRFSDRVVESFRIEARELDIYDPLLDEILDTDDTEFDVSESARAERASSEAPAASGVEIRVLGPIEVVGWTNEPERAVVTELACYLVLHRDRPVSGDLLRAALRPDATTEQSAKTIRTYVSLLRRAIGTDALPACAGGGYQLSTSVTSDWARFVSLARAEDPEDILEALALVRGRPFQGVPAGTYGWVFSEFLISDMEVAIVRTTFAVAGHLVEMGDRERALWALRQGLLAVNGDYGLWQRYLSLSAEVGPAALARAQAEARAALGDDVPKDA